MQIEEHEKDEKKKDKKERRALDRAKIDVLLAELSEYLNFEDVYEIKK